MIDARLQETIAKHIAEPISKIEALSGGYSYPSYVVTTPKERLFLKYSEKHTEAFIKEANGLTEITEVIHDFCPDVVTANNSFLILDYITPERPTHLFWQGLASKLAKLHKVKKEAYGYFEDNFIGATEQINRTKTQTLSWADFFWSYRIEPQLKMNETRNSFKLSEMQNKQLKSSIMEQLSNYNAYPTVLHGDLWNGNIHCGEKQKAYILDPALYFGDREADIAMTECFGGFSEQFYSVYNEILPLDKGYEQRKHIYNLYHILNHYYLFGSGYKDASVNLIERVSHP